MFDKNAICAIFNSTLFWWFFIQRSDYRNINNREINQFPVDLNITNKEFLEILVKLNKSLMKNLTENSVFIENNYVNAGITFTQTFFIISPNLSSTKLTQY
jgi:hypothetical protein